MRARSFKPGFFENEYLASLSPHARLLFIGLWCMADREGRLENRPLRIHGLVFPYEPDLEIEKLLDELEKCPEQFIKIYEVDGKRYIQVNNFGRHQNPHRNEKSSTLPAFSESAGVYRATRVIKRANPVDSGLLNHESISGDFDIFYQAYPKHVGKKDALKSYTTARKDVDHQTIMDGVTRYKAKLEREKTEAKYIQAPAAWLNKGRWDDEYNQTTPYTDTIPEHLQGLSY